LLEGIKVNDPEIKTIKTLVCDHYQEMDKFQQVRNSLLEEITFISHGGNTNNTGDEGAGTGRQHYISAIDDDCGRGRGRFGGLGCHGCGHGQFSGGHGGCGGTNLFNGVDVSNLTCSFTGA
jgi:hypothetical protein